MSVFLCASDLGVKLCSKLFIDLCISVGIPACRYKHSPAYERRENWRESKDSDRILKIPIILKRPGGRG